MTDEVNPSATRAADALLTAGAMRYGGGDWIVPAGEEYYADAPTSELTGTPLSGFDASHSTSSFTVTFDTGEAFVMGAWVGRDTTTDVQLSSAKTGQTVYLGWAVGATNTVIIGLDGAFGAKDPRVPIYEFDTDGSGVMAARDSRPLGEQINVRNEGSAAVADSAEQVDGTDVDGEVAEAAHADDADALGGTVTAAEIRAHANFNSNDIVNPNRYYYDTDMSGDPHHFQREASGSGTALTFEGTNVGVNKTTPTVPLDVGGVSNHNGYDVRNIGSLSATTADVGGSPVLTESDESGLNVDNSDKLGSVPAKKIIGMQSVTLPGANFAGKTASTIATIPGGWNAEVLYMDLRDHSDGSQAVGGTSLQLRDSNQYIRKEAYNETPTIGEFEENGTPLANTSDGYLRFTLDGSGASDPAEVSGTAKFALYPA